MLAYSKASNVEGRGRTGIGGLSGLGESIAFAPEPCDIDFRRAHGQNRRDAIVHRPAHIKWYCMPTFAYVGLVDGAVQYRFGTNGEAIWRDCPVALDPAQIQQIGRMFDIWYDYLGLPAALNELLEQAPLEPVDRSDKMALIEKYLEDGSRSFLHEVLGAPDEDDIVFWVDWREDEEDIVRLCEAVLRTGTLSARYLPNDVSADLEIFYKGRTVIAQYRDGLADRDTTLLALQAALAPDYEIRYCAASHGSDTAALLPLSPTQWASLEAIKPDSVEKLFRPLSADRPIFSGDRSPVGG